MLAVRSPGIISLRTTYFNVKRLAYELSTPPEAALQPGISETSVSPLDVEAVVRSVVNEILTLK